MTYVSEVPPIALSNLGGLSDSSGSASTSSSNTFVLRGLFVIVHDVIRYKSWLKSPFSFGQTSKTMASQWLPQTMEKLSLLAPHTPEANKIYHEHVFTIDIEFDALSGASHLIKQLGASIRLVQDGADRLKSSDLSVPFNRTSYFFTKLPTSSELGLLLNYTPTRLAIQQCLRSQYCDYFCVNRAPTRDYECHILVEWMGAATEDEWILEGYDFLLREARRKTFNAYLKKISQSSSPLEINGFYTRQRFVAPPRVSAESSVDLLPPNTPFYYDVDPVKMIVGVPFVINPNFRPMWLSREQFWLKVLRSETEVDANIVQGGLQDLDTVFSMTALPLGFAQKNLLSIRHSHFHIDAFDPTFLQKLGEGAFGTVVRLQWKARQGHDGAIHFAQLEHRRFMIVWILRQHLDMLRQYDQTKNRPSARVILTSGISLANWLPVKSLRIDGLTLIDVTNEQDVLAALEKLEQAEIKTEVDARFSTSLVIKVQSSKFEPNSASALPLTFKKPDQKPAFDNAFLRVRQEAQLMALLTNEYRFDDKIINLYYTAEQPQQPSWTFKISSLLFGNTLEPLPQTVYEMMKQTHELEISETLLSGYRDILLKQSEPVKIGFRIVESEIVGSPLGFEFEWDDKSVFDNKSTVLPLSAKVLRSKNNSSVAVIQDGAQPFRVVPVFGTTYKGDELVHVMPQMTLGSLGGLMKVIGNKWQSIFERKRSPTRTNVLDLHYYRRKNNPFGASKVPSLYQLLGIFADILNSLRILGRRGVVHRDVKEDNILLDAQLNGWLGDFGISAIFGNAQTPLAGTEAYVPGELIQKLSELSPNGIYQYSDNYFDMYAFARMMQFVISPNLKSEKTWIYANKHGITAYGEGSTAAFIGSTLSEKVANQLMAEPTEGVIFTALISNDLITVVPDNESIDPKDYPLSKRLCNEAIGLIRAEIEYWTSRELQNQIYTNAAANLSDRTPVVSAEELLLTEMRMRIVMRAMDVARGL
jgi:serine/threonine protein kinase